MWLHSLGAREGSAGPLSRSGEGQGEGSGLSGEGMPLTPNPLPHGRGGPSRRPGLAPKRRR
ncbi:hypothetical protein FV229_19145 [Methylobacterium sp. WL120]|nr:hypothetical protein FV229_19145 [Methylobacterium sp. WL120]